MGQTVPIRHQFIPPQPSPSSQPTTMIKVWTYYNQYHAQKQLHHFDEIKQTLLQQQCRIDNLYTQYLGQSGEWKVLAIFEYYNKSLRQHIIQRKKQSTHRKYFTQKQLQTILNIMGLYIYKYHKYLCNHSDIMSNIFIDGKEYKICHPQLLPNRCIQPHCNQIHIKQKITDSVMEMMLLQKIIKADHKYRYRAHQLYTHAQWLIQLINDLFDNTKDIVQLSKRSAIVREEMIKKQKLSTARQTEIQDILQSAHSGGQREFINNNDIKVNHKYTINQPHYRSHSAQFLSYQNKPNKKIQPYFNLISLQNYHKQLAQSIVDHQQSILLPNYQLNETMRIADHIQQRQQHQNQPQTGSFMILEQMVTQQDSRGNENNRSRSVYSVLPHTILQEQSQNNSQDSRKYLQEKQSVIINQQTGSNYEGDRVNGKKHGKGTIVFANGVYYSGDWLFDQMTGFGTLYYASGKPQYIGEWKHNKFNGKGCYYNKNQQYFQGGFNYKDFDELGYKWKSCEGEFIDDMMQGEGMLTLSNGQILKANWRKNLLNGEGIFYTIDNKKVKGLWLDNKLFSCQIEND